MTHTENNKLPYDEWLNTLEHMSDEQVSHNLKDMILADETMPDDMKKLFTDVFEYSVQKIQNNKTFDLELLKIYLKDIKGYTNIENTNLYPILILLSLCGINWFVDNAQ